MYYSVVRNCFFNNTVLYVYSTLLDTSRECTSKWITWAWPESWYSLARVHSIQLKLVSESFTSSEQIWRWCPWHGWQRNLGNTNSIRVPCTVPMRVPTEHAPELLPETWAEEHIDIDVNACRDWVFPHWNTEICHSISLIQSTSTSQSLIVRYDINIIRVYCKRKYFRGKILGNKSKFICNDI